MSVRWERFSGDTSKFALKVAFHADPDEGAAMDADTAASWGAMQVWVDGVNLCSHVDQGETLQSSHWYVLPILEWLVSSWEPLLHEERLPSSSNRFVTAADLASVTPALLFADVGASDALALDERRYEWEQRHSLRVARDGGLLPDLRFRRLRDQIEVSWNNTPLAGATDAEFVARQGRSLQEPGDVAGALYEVLKDSVAWLQRQRPSERLNELALGMSQLPVADRGEERTAWLAGLGDGRTQVLDHWERVVTRVESFADPAAFEGTFGVPRQAGLVLDGSCEAALLFGSVSPTIDESDALGLAHLLLDQHETDAPDGLADLVRDEPVDLSIPAWEHGYELAESVLEEAGEELLFDTSDIELFLNKRGVGSKEIELSDHLVRAISFASPNHVPTIALNTSSRHYVSPTARRFTLAHELCHLLFDRTRGARLAVASGPWAPKPIEQRANAFAAMLLMPPKLLAGAIDESEVGLDSPSGVEAIASRLGVGVSSLLEHAYNVGLIDEAVREDLRSAFDRPR